MRVFFIAALFIFITGFLFAEEIFKYDVKGKRDPFIPLISKDGVYVTDAYGISSIKDVRLEGIVWDDEEGSIAIVNGIIVRKGEGIGSAKVLEIKRDGVVFEIGGEVVKIELSND